MGRRIGIDLGTTCSCVSYVDDCGRVRIIDNMEGTQITPSVVFFEPNGQNVLVGEEAQWLGAGSPEMLVERVKNYMGDPFFSCYINGKEYSPTEISTFILQKLVNDTEQYLGEEIEGAVITCPAYFGSDGKRETLRAARSVTTSNGKPLEVLNLIPEPIAAAIAYQDYQQEDKDKTLLIYDLGGGTFDCTVVRLKTVDGKKEREIIAIDGNHQLGGKDWDNELKRLVVQKFCAETGVDEWEMEDDPDMQAWFSQNIEKAKKNLTSRETTMLAPSFDGNKARIEITREEFENVTSALLESSILLVNDMMDRNGLSVENDIDEILLVGGSTYMAQVRMRLEQEYGKPIFSFEPNKIVAMGAALVANGDEERSTIEEKKEETTLFVEERTVEKRMPFWCYSTKSYGIILFYNGEEKVVNVLKKDSRICEEGLSASTDKILSGLTFTGKHEKLKAVRLRVVENDGLEDVVERCLCDDIYEDEWIELDPNTYGDDQIQVTMSKNLFGDLSIYLENLSENRMYAVKCRRKEWQEGVIYLRSEPSLRFEDNLSKEEQQYYLSASVGCIAKVNGREVFCNVLNQSVRFSKEGYRATIEMEAQENLTVNIAICDTAKPQAGKDFIKIGQMVVPCENLSRNAQITFSLGFDSKLEVIVKVDEEERKMILTTPAKLQIKRFAGEKVSTRKEKKCWTLAEDDGILVSEEKEEEQSEELVLGDNLWF